MLDFNDSPFVCSSLFQVIFVIAGSRRQLAVGGCVRVKNSYVKECIPPVTAPEILGFDVQPCPVFYIGTSVGKGLSTQWLKSWLNGHVGTHLR